jgi:Virulence-associated protein E/VirE N-terminal domain
MGKNLACYLPSIRNASNFTVQSITDILADIKSEKYAPLLAKLPNAHTHTEAYKEAKKNLPAWAFNGTFKESVTNKNFLASSGFFHFDIDDLKDVEKTFQDIIDSIPEIYALWRSPSGLGLKGLLRVQDSFIVDDGTFKHAFKQIEPYFKTKGFVLDQSCKDVRRLCFVCADKHIFIDTDTQPFIPQLSVHRELPSIPVHHETRQQPSDKDKQFCITQIEAIFNHASMGGYHDARLRAGKLAGGFVAANRLSNSEAWACLNAMSDTIHAAHGDSSEVVARESKAVFDGFQVGLSEPAESSFIEFTPEQKREYAQKKAADKLTTDIKKTVFDLSTPTDVESFYNYLLESITNETSELECINIVSSAICNQSKGFDKTIAEYLAAQFAKNFLQFDKKKTILKSGIFERVKQAKLVARKESKLSFIDLKRRLEPYSFPDYMEYENGGVKILSTIENLEHLLLNYGISCFYDEAIKHQGLIIPNDQSFNHDLHAESCQQTVASLASKNDINENIVSKLPVLMTKRTINPVKDWILSAPWDGLSRIGYLCDTLTVANDKRELSNALIKTWLIQCVAALDRAKIGCEFYPNAVPKYELILVLQGEQGLSKTKWFGNLLPQSLNGERFSSRYIKDGSNLVLGDKDSIKQNISCWINELGELDATFRKSDIAALKAFCSNQTDTIRLPYAKTECSFKRSTSFCASVNDDKFLNDSTGSRRFAVIAVQAVGLIEDDSFKQQLWREVWELYAAGWQWWIDKDTEQAMQENNAINHQSINPIEDAILSKFEWDKPQSLWTYKMTATDIYQACFDKKPNRTDLNAIKPILERQSVVITKPKNVLTFFMPSSKT